VTLTDIELVWLPFKLVKVTSVGRQLHRLLASLQVVSYFVFNRLDDRTGRKALWQVSHLSEVTAPESLLDDLLFFVGILVQH
jgi:hypothetical protein